MRVKRTEKTVYKFNELDDKAQHKALDKLWDINVDYEWWDCIFDDAKRAGIKIKEFDIDRGSFIKGELTNTLEFSLDAILKDHGDACDTWKTAKEYKDGLDELTQQWDDTPAEEKDDAEYEYEQKCEELKENFEHDILEDYLIMLRKEYEHQTSREAILEIIEANEYEFDESGNFA